MPRRLAGFLSLIEIAHSQTPKTPGATSNLIVLPGPFPDVRPDICCRMAKLHICTMKLHFCLVPAATQCWEVEPTSTGFPVNDPT